jgi:hypothetical protein
MILETAQLLCSVFDPGVAPYKRTHYNHPCSIWTRKSYENYQWLLNHGFALCDEYTVRYDKQHKSKEIISWCAMNVKPEMFSQVTFTEHPKCMPEECKVDDIVESYRNYYRTNKREIAKWKQNQPEWWD